MKYVEAKRPGFSAVATIDGAIYHQRGEYEITTDTGVLIPANRSYRQLEGTDPNHIHSHQLSRDNFTNHDRIINDRVDNPISLKDDERIISLYGKRLFCLDTSRERICREFSPDPEMNPYASRDSTELVDYLKEATADCEAITTIGVYGSHQMSIHKNDSDIDLIAWASRDKRQEAIAAIAEALESKGYIPAHNQPELIAKYATRYAGRMNISIEAGYILAAERQRWISPEGISTSLQCFHSDYNHSWAKAVVDDGVEEVEVKEKVRIDNVRVVSDPEPYNFPRLWSVSINDGEPVNALSIDWAHQGMASDKNDIYTMQASKVTTALGHTAFILSVESDFILPTRMV